MARRPRTDRQRRHGRGRLSTLDLLPEEADADLAWLNEELREGRRTQIDLLDEFNARVARLGVAPITKSAFSRYSVRKATQFRQLDETRRISVELAGMMGVDSADRMTIALSEMLKMAAFKLAEGGGLSPRDVMELARANQAAVGAQKTSAEYRRGLVAELEGKARAAMDRVEDEVEKGTTAPDGAAVLRRIREEIYGIFDAV